MFNLITIESDSGSEMRLFVKGRTLTDKVFSILFDNGFTCHEYKGSDYYFTILEFQGQQNRRQALTWLRNESKQYPIDSAFISNLADFLSWLNLVMESKLLGSLVIPKSIRLY